MRTSFEYSLGRVALAGHVALLVLAGVACPATSPTNQGGTTAGPGVGAGGAGGATTSTAGGSTGTSAGSGGALFDGGSGGTGGCAPCSADLKSIVDCAGNVLMTCDPGKACSQGVCVDNPCDAAVAGKSSIGCEYWALNLDNILPGACFAAFVTNTWTAPVHIQVDYAGAPLTVAHFTKIPQGQGTSLTYAPYDDVAGLAPGNVAILFLSQAPQLGPPLGEPCPAGITPAITTDPAVHGTGRGKGFHITTDGPIVGYQIFPYGGGNAAITSATLLLPTSAWDTNYVAVNAYAPTQLSNNWGLPSLDILAGEDGTQVTISPVAAIAPGGGVAGTGQGQPAAYTLDKGQYVQFSQAAELTGSAIVSDKPVAVFGGHSCMNVPASQSACDTGQQQIPPVHALGHEYAAVRYRGRAGNPNEVVPWRLVGAIDGTMLTYTPSAPPGAPSTLAGGQVAEFESPGPFLVASQDADHPFYAAGFMTGGENLNGEGDPEFVNIIPTAQYLSSYVFFTDPTYPETNLVLVRAKGPNGFADVKLDCAGTLGGWQPLGAYEYTRVDLVTGNFQGVNGCANGRHFIESQAPFGVTVWGWGSLASFPFYSQYVSYAYPAGAGVRAVNSTTVPAIPK